VRTVNAKSPRVRSAKQGRAGPQASGGHHDLTLAYHLIWTTYGTWLPGDARGWIKSGVLGIQSPDPALEQQARDMMAEAEVRLTPAQRAAVELTIRKHCHIRNWILHAVNVRSNVRLRRGEGQG
jgi:hypothetical protein